MIILDPIQLWLGVENGANVLLDAERYFAKQDLASVHLRSAELLANKTVSANDYADHYMITSYGNGVASISVTGSLASSSIPLRAWGFNATSYEEIQQSIKTVAKDPSIDKIVMLYNTPGGSNNGLNRTSQMLAKLSDLKEVYSFTDSQMASAGYWLGVNAKKIVADQMAQVGSVGVYVIMHSYSKQLEEMGVDVKVVRAGEFKALGLPVEPLSKAAISETQDRVDLLYDAFLDHVSTARGMTKEGFRKKAGEGRVFSGNDAVKAGLVDKLALFDDFIAELLQSGNKVKPKAGAPASTKLSGSQDMNIFELLAKLGISLSDSQTAALSSGAELNAIGLPAAQVKQIEAAMAEASAEEDEADDPSAADLKTEDPTQDPTQDPTKVKAEDPKAKTGEAPGALADLTDRLLGMQSKLTKAETGLEAAQLRADQLQTQLDDLNTQMSALKEIAIDRTKALAAAMRKTCAGLESLSATQLVAEFKKTKGEFEKTFPVGQKSKSSDTTPTPGRQVPPPHVQKAALEATKFQP